MQIVVVSLAFVVVAGAVLGAVFLGGMRAKWPPVVDRVRAMNRRFLAAQQMETAGGPGAYAGVLRHRGRSSGKAYATPVTIKPSDGAFVMAMVYGRRTDWVKNVLAAGSAVIELDGDTVQVDQPEIVPMAEVADAFSAGDQRVNRLIGVDECLRVRPVAGA